MSPAVIGQTVTVMDKSGKIISTSKTLFNVFREAKTAYLDKKAEIATKRRYEQDRLETTRAFGALNIDDDRSVGSRGSRRHGSVRRSRSSEDTRSMSRGGSVRHRDREASRSIDHGSPRGGLPRRNTTAAHTIPAHGPPNLRREVMHRSTTSPGPVDIDMDMAYGEIPPPLPGYRESEVRNMFSKASFLLDEANCVGHSATKMIGSLQKNPEAMAAIALTLAEISQVVQKLGPGAVMALRGSFPAVFALLASPQFLIAAGVGVGITVVAFGGYKIIRQLKARNSERETERDTRTDNLEEIAPSLHSIDHWRRGIADAEAASAATSVDGEFITPAARELNRTGGRHSSSSLGPPPTYTSEARYAPHPNRGSDWESVTSTPSRHGSRTHSRSHSYSSDLYRPRSLREESSTHDRRDRDRERERESSHSQSRTHSSRAHRGEGSEHGSRRDSERGSTTSSHRSRTSSNRDSNRDRERDRDGERHRERDRDSREGSSSRSSRRERERERERDPAKKKKNRGLSLRRVLFRSSTTRD